MQSLSIQTNTNNIIQTVMASVTHRVSKLIVLFLVVYFRSVKCTLVHDTATDNVDEIFENISEELTETRLRLVSHLNKCI
jgi:hypothetical protein